MTSMLKMHMILDNFISVRRNKKSNDIFKKEKKKKAKQTNNNKTKQTFLVSYNLKTITCKLI